MLADVAEQLGSSGTAVLVASVSMVAIYLAIILATRLAGPRSLAERLTLHVERGGDRWTPSCRAGRLVPMPPRHQRPRPSTG